jgi:16S rRNA (adenine1518-N6/adenine1519-N6)-dimethyltransferase
VEIDPRFSGLLRRRFGDNPNFKLVQQDVLDIGNRELCQLVSGGGDNWQVVANLPYSITSATIERFVLGKPRPKSLTLMLQKEVVDRLLGRPKKASALTMAVQMVADLELVCKVPRDLFWPAPKVDSAVIHITPWSAEKRQRFLGGVPEDFLEKVVRAGFNNRRRQLKNSLSHLHLSAEQVKKCLERAEIPAKARPEELVPEQWVRLAEKILQLEDKSG